MTATMDDPDHGGGFWHTSQFQAKGLKRRQQHDLEFPDRLGTEFAISQASRIVFEHRRHTRLGSGHERTTQDKQRKSD